MKNIFAILLLVAISLLCTALVTAQSSSPSSTTYLIAFQYQYVATTTTTTSVPSSSPSSSSSFNTQQFMTDIFNRVSLPTDSYYLINSRTVVEDSTTQNGNNNNNNLKYEMQVIFSSRVVYGTIINATSSLLDNNFLLLSNTIKLASVSGIAPSPAVTPIYPKEALGIAVIVTIAVVCAFLACLMYGIIKSSKEDFKTTQQMTEARTTVSFQSEQQIDESQFLHQNNYRSQQSTAVFSSVEDTNDSNNNKDAEYL